MSYKHRMLEGPHPLAGILVWLPNDIKFSAIEWIPAPEWKPPSKPAKPGRNRQTPRHGKIHSSLHHQCFRVLNEDGGLCRSQRLAGLLRDLINERVQ